MAQCRPVLQLAAGVVPSTHRPRESRNCTQQATDDIINDVHDIVIADSQNTLTLSSTFRAFWLCEPKGSVHAIAGANR